jgi:hypothetical protein
VIEGNVADRCLLSSVSELFDRERVMIDPRAPEFFQHVARGRSERVCRLRIVRCTVELQGSNRRFVHEVQHEPQIVKRVVRLASHLGTDQFPVARH